LLIRNRVYQEYYATHQLKHETQSSISWIGSLQIFFLFGGALFGGPLFDRFGAKASSLSPKFLSPRTKANTSTQVIWPPSLTYIFSVMMTSISKKYWHFLLAQGILGGFCMGMSMGPAMAAVGQYFHKKRGAAMGLSVAGSSLGGVIFPIALSKMLYNPSLGFGWSVRILGFIMLALILPACFFIRARLPPRPGQFFLPKAFKELLYLSIIASVFLMIIGLFTPFFYLPTYAVQHGMSAQLGSYLISILNGASFLGRVIPGILADKLGPLNMLCAAGLSTGILVFAWQAATTNVGIIVFSAFYGFCSGAIISLMTFALASVPKNPQNIGTYMGMGMAITSVAALIGPPINGSLVTRYHGFKQSMDMSGVFVVVGALGILVAKHFHEKGLFAKN
jgi:MFS family permease